MRKHFKWNMVWETFIQNQHTDPLQCPSFWHHYHKTLEKNNSLVILHLASNRTQSHVYFVFWERHWSHSLRKLRIQKIEIIPSTLNFLSQGVWTTFYYFTVQKCLKVFKSFQWATRNRYSFTKLSNIYVPNIAQKAVRWQKKYGKEQKLSSSLLVLYSGEEYIQKPSDMREKDSTTFFQSNLVFWYLKNLTSHKVLRVSTDTKLWSKNFHLSLKTLLIKFFHKEFAISNQN